MSYSNGRLPEDTHGKIVEIIKGLPGVGFKLTSDGDYDINNKKLTNVLHHKQITMQVPKNMLMLRFPRL